MDFLLVIVIGAIMAATGVINPIKQDPKDVAKAPETQVTTPVVKEPEPEPTPTPTPTPEPTPTPTPEPTPTPAPEPTPTPAPEPEPQTEEPKEEVNSEQTQEQDAKPEEEEITPAQEKTVEASEDKGLSMLNIILYILGAIAVIAAGIYFFMRREPERSADDIARSQSQESTPELQEEQPVQEETYSEPEPEPKSEQPVQEEAPSETTQE